MADPAPQAYHRVIRQAAHDAVRALLAAPPDAPEASAALRGVTDWLAAAHGASALRDLAEELAVDLAEAFDAIAGVEGVGATAVADRWFHDEPRPAAPDSGGRPPEGGGRRIR